MTVVKKPFRKISTKYLIWLIPIIALAFLFFGFYIYKLMKIESIAINKEISEKLAEEVNRALMVWISEQIKIGKTIAADPRIIKACNYPQNYKIRNNAEDFLNEMHDRFPYNENIPVAIKISSGKKFFRKINGKNIPIHNGNFFMDTVNGATIGKCGTDISYIPPAFSGKDHFISEVYPSILRGNPIFVI